MKNKVKYWLWIIFFGSIILLCEIKAYKIGENKGFDKALDTVNAIVKKQIKSDTSVTRLVLVHPDTNYYILSRKTVLDKKP